MNYLTQHPAFVDSGATDYYPSEVPDDAVYPYVSTPGDATGRPWYTMADMKGEDVIWGFHVWCDANHGGAAKTAEVGDAVMAAMDNAIVAADGWKTLKFQRIFSTQPQKQDDDPKLYRQVIRYHLILEKA